MPSPFLGRRLPSLAMLLSCCITTFPAAGQGTASPSAHPTARTLRTADGLDLRITYYPSDGGRAAAPVVMLHDFKESREVFDRLAQLLNAPRRPHRPGGEERPGAAVVTVDLRGHGQSQSGIDADGNPFALDAERLQVEDFRDMVRLDLEAVRAFLIDENDAGRLNLNALSVIGSGLGANVALLWAARDWAAPPLAVRKQGQDVKGLALISPRWNFRGLNLVEPMRFAPLLTEPAVFLAYGGDDREVLRDGQNVARAFVKHHPLTTPGGEARRDWLEIALETKVQGTPLLTNSDFNLGPRLLGFLDERVARRNYEYMIRKTNP